MQVYSVKKNPKLTIFSSRSDPDLMIHIQFEFWFKPNTLTLFGFLNLNRSDPNAPCLQS